LCSNDAMNDKNNQDQTPNPGQLSEDAAELKRKIQSSPRFQKASGEIGTDANVYQNSGLGSMKETSGNEDEVDEADDTRLGAV
jgi:hypothetical protein